MHVRGFTKHSSSGVKGKGTFAGIVEKIPYLKELGVTTVELQPIYEFNEKPAIENNAKQQLLLQEPKLNYWGYQDAYYYAPKQAYSYKTDASVECKDMIKAFHENHMEVIMQVYFKNDTAISEIINVLRFWHMEYHVDGFHLLGDCVPDGVIATEPILKKTKLILLQQVYEFLTFLTLNQKKAVKIKLIQKQKQKNSLTSSNQKSQMKLHLFLSLKNMLLHH
jgi:glycogen operon protein